jgi:nucleoprotein TPR
VASNAKVNAVRQRLDSALSELQTLQDKTICLESEKKVVEEELARFREESSGINETVKTLQRRVETITADKQSILETLERRNTELRELRGELETTQARVLENRKVIVDLENQLQQGRTNQMTAQLRDQSLSQEIELLKRSNEWLDSELKAKTEEFKKFRTDKLSRLSTLQNDFESIQSMHNSLVASNEALKERFEDLSKSYDNCLIKVKDLQNNQVVAEEGFRSEMISQQRLTELWERSAKDAKNRVEELEKTLEVERSRESTTLSRWKAEGERQRVRADKLDEQIKSLESKLQDVYTREEAPATPGQPRTPNRDGSPATGAGVFSPSAQIISQIQRGGGSLVQLYSDFQETRTRLERERHKNEALRREMDQILEEMENHAPAILAEREENRRLELELADLSAQLDASTSEMDELKSKLKMADLQYKDSSRENAMISQQVRDLSRQVQQLLIQNQLDADAEAPLNPKEHAALQQFLNGDGDEGSDTDKLISKRLVLFKDIIELQRQNENLLKVTRQLGQKMEHEEAEAKKRYENLESAAVEDAKKAIKSLHGDLQRLTTRSESLQRERDMFRRMLSNRSDGEQQQDAIQASSNDQVERILKQNQETAEMLKEAQQNYETYRSETSVTIKTLNEQISVISNERGSLHIKVSKLQSQLELTNERFKTAKDNIEILKSENGEFKKRIQSLQEALSQQDVRTQQVADELVETRSLLESVRNEASNLKAEKALWKSIEERITKENAELFEEKGKLNGLLRNVELMSTEREATFKESERRLLSQVETLETQVVSANRRVEAEQEALKKLSDRREMEVAEFQIKLERLSEEVKTSKELLVSAKSNCVQLESRAKELSILLAASEEKVRIYQQPSSDRAKSADARLSEITTLQASLDLKTEELKQADTHIRELTEVASAAEEALTSMNASYDEFRNTTNKSLEQKDVSARNLSIKGVSY